MDIELSRDAIKHIGIEPLARFGVTKDWMKYGSNYVFSMMNMTRKAAADFHMLLTDSIKSGCKLENYFRRRAIEAKDWLDVLADKTGKPVKKVKDFVDAIKLVLRDAPKHWIYKKDEYVDAWQPFFVDSIAYVERKRNRDGIVIDEEHVDIRMCYEVFGKYQKQTISIYAEDIKGFNPVTTLARWGYKLETPEILLAYQHQLSRYSAMYNDIGLQCEAVGVMELESSNDRNDYWWRRVQRTITIDKDGVPGRVVVDIYKEGEDDGRGESGERPMVSFWAKDPVDYEGSDDDDDNDIKPGDEDEDEQIDKTVLDYEIPVMPKIKLFDLRRHQRVSGRVEQLEIYQYQEGLHDKLILPTEHKELIDIMIGNHGGFGDIINNKGNGTIVLCDGKPGTGKTLTSEVGAEAMKKPLYSVQCSQIGLKPDDIEDELLKILARAQRWKAILLLDEADVYVMKRGNDLQQNAIVGVFLRVLEYYRGIMFLTTNRGDDVDDAIASRCLARIGYTTPSQEDQKRIWKTLSQTSGIEIADKEIDKIVKAHDNLSGRDVKNLLKLAGIVSRARGTVVDAETVKYVKRFKPTE